jgi:hypothetical protein
MSKAKTPWLTYGLIAAAGVGAWWLWNNSKQAATPSPAGIMPASPALPAPGGQVISDQVMAPVPSQQLPVATTQPSLPNGIPANVYSVVQSWAQGDGRAPVLVMAAANVPSEYAGMFDIITNYWDQNIKPGTAQLTFWNNLRGKYDPGDEIW